MNTEPNTPGTELPDAQAADAVRPADAALPASDAGGRPAGRAPLRVIGALAVLALLLSGLLWQKLTMIQEQVARQSSDSSSNAIEARTMARQAQ